MAPTIIVENAEARVVTIPGHHLRAGAEFPDALLPGVNKVDAEEWNRALKIPVVRHMVQAGQLKPDTAKKGDLVSLTDDEALSLVLRTVDEKLLRTWLAREKRAAVRQALEEQLEALKPGPEKDEDEGKKK